MNTLKNKLCIFLLAIFGVMIILDAANGSALLDDPLKATPTESRFLLAKEVLQENPDATMRSVSRSLYEKSWVSDFGFVRQQIVNQPARPMQADILRALDMINDGVGKNIHLMSFSYLNFAWGVVAEVLSPLDRNFIGFDSFESKLNSLHREYAELLLTVEARFASGKLYQANSSTGHLPIYLDQILMSPPGIFVLPHVSKTGFLKIPQMIEGLAFEVNDRNYALAFLAIGTNERLSYDGYEGKDASSSRMHDCRHLQSWHLCAFNFYGSGGPSNMSYRFTREFPLVDDVYSTPQQEIDEMMQFKKSIASVLSEPSALYNLFMAFHENLSRSHTISQTIQLWVNYTPHPHLSSKIAIDPAKIANMNDAKSLMSRGFEFEGNTPEEQYQSYLSFQDEGHSLIHEVLSSKK